MCMGGGKSPKVEEVPPPPEPAKEPDKQVREAGDSERKKAMANGGMGNTITTTGLGLPGQASVTKKKLLGR